MPKRCQARRAGRRAATATLSPAGSGRIKVVALDLGEAWHTDGVINDVMIDIEALANRAAQAEC
jgi:hypothetical protein